MVTIHQVRKVLGEDVANALYEHFPGQQIYIPKKACSMSFESQEDRDECIYNLYTKSGKTYDEIIDILGLELTKDRIQKIVSSRYNNKK